MLQKYVELINKLYILGRPIIHPITDMKLY